ncbi:MAG: F0F1 ATP synthase subunit A [Bacteroidetes bacterium]|nr:F0F1 ATP synthase subunit A [Bacteroidota bacterium]
MDILKHFAVTLFILFTVPFSYANQDKSEKPFDVGEMIMHHVKDAHEWHLWGDEHKGTSIYLPVIIYDNGLKTFSSRYLYHGKKVSFTDKTGNEYHIMMGEGPANGYALFHEKIYKLNNGILNIHEGHPTNAKPLDFSITKNVSSLFIGAIIITSLMLLMARYYKSNGAVAPKGIAKFIEPLVIVIRDDIAQENIGHGKHHKYVPYLLTIFFFVWINNLLGLVPIFPGGANLTGNITITFFLALCTLLITLFSSNKNYWKHIFATPGVPVALMPIMIPIELVGILTKPFALMIRLFANITAGHIIILALISIIFINKNMAWGALSVPMALFISCLEMLVAVLQAYLFALLSALFIGAAVEEAHH